MPEVAVARSQAFLKTNLAKRGWKVSDVDGSATLEDLELTMADSGWTIKKNGVDVGSGSYGSNQMADVRKATVKAGVKFDTVATGPAKGPSARQPLTEEQKQARKGKRNARKETGGQNPNPGESGVVVAPPIPSVKPGPEKFKTILSHNDWIEQEGGKGWRLGSLRVVVFPEKWTLIHYEKPDHGVSIAEGTFADRAYAVIESQMAKLGLLRE